jgi:hypothetical protein
VSADLRELMEEFLDLLEQPVVRIAIARTPIEMAHIQGEDSERHRIAAKLRDLLTEKQS